MINQKDTLKLNSGNSIPVMGLGTWQLTIDTAETVLYAFQQGYHLIDTSSDYGTQPGIGEAIQKTEVPRDHLYIATKVEETDDAFPATKKYIQEMNLDYANLMLIHRPPLNGVGIDFMIIQAYSPLTRAKRLEDEKLVKIAEKYNKSTAQILIRWNLQQQTLPIPKANQKSHVEENFNVFDFEINQEDIEYLNRLNEHYSSLGSLPYV